LHGVPSSAGAGTVDPHAAPTELPGRTLDLHDLPARHPAADRDTRADPQLRLQDGPHGGRRANAEADRCPARRDAIQRQRSFGEAHGARERGAAGGRREDNCKRRRRALP
jgi:hypothetical protein